MLKVNNRLRSHALTITLVIALVLGVLTTTIILLAYYNKDSATSFNKESVVSAHMASAVNYVLADASLPLQPSAQTLSLPDKEAIPVNINRFLWGLFEVANIKVKAGRWQKEQTFFCGGRLPSFMEGCLYLADHRRPLSLVGHTLLTGDAYISSQGLKAGTIEGRGYHSSRLIDGAIKRSNSEVPALPDDILAYIASLQQGNYAGSNRAKIENGRFVNSFANPVAVIKQQGPLYLDRLVLKGHVLIQSDSYIEVGKNAELENVLLIAPVIRFKQQFEGTVQAIAKDSLLVEDGCKLNYPSTLIVLKQQPSTVQPLLKIGASCFLSGMVITICPPADHSKSFVRINENTFLQGVLWVNGYLSLKGKIKGCVLTDYFWHSTRMGEYENYLVDVEMNRKKLPDYFIGPSCLETGGSKQIMQWVD